MTDKVGYKNPPKHTRFGEPGGNIPGKTSEQRKLEIQNAEKATRIRGRLLDALESVALEKVDDEAIALIEASVMKLLKDSEDRGLGAPKTSVDLTSSDGSMSPKGLDEFYGEVD